MRRPGSGGPVIETILIGMTLDAVVLWCFVAAIVLAAALALRARRRFDFAVDVGADGAVTFRGTFPPGCRAETIDFFQGAFAPPGPLTVFGTWQRGRRGLRLRIRGVPVGRQQVVRNFFMTTLRP